MISLASAVGMVVPELLVAHNSITFGQDDVFNDICRVCVGVDADRKDFTAFRDGVCSYYFFHFCFLYGVDGRSAVAMSLVKNGFSVVCIMYWKFWAGADVTCSSVESNSYLYTFCKVPSGRAASSNP